MHFRDQCLDQWNSRDRVLLMWQATNVEGRGKERKYYQGDEPMAIGSGPGPEEGALGSAETPTASTRKMMCRLATPAKRIVVIVTGMQATIRFGNEGEK